MTTLFFCECEYVCVVCVCVCVCVYVTVCDVQREGGREGCLVVLTVSFSSSQHSDDVWQARFTLLSRTHAQEVMWSDVSSIVTQKIATSRGDLGTWEVRKHNEFESIKLCKKLASVCFKLQLKDTVHQRHKQCLFIGNRSHAYRGCLLSAHAHLSMWTGKDHRDVLNNARDMLYCLPASYSLTEMWSYLETNWNVR
jgi:hypothetical protein